MCVRMYNCGINKGATRFGANHYGIIAMYGHVCTVPFDDRAPGHPARVRAYLNKIIVITHTE
jgi:hypothetical protein